MDIKKFIKIIGIEILILTVLNPIINKYFVYSTRMSAGSWGIFAPLPLYEKIYSNSQFLRIGFNFPYLVIDLAIIIGIGFLFTFLKFKRK
jgi:hypothetical protein